MEKTTCTVNLKKRITIPLLLALLVIHIFPGSLFGQKTFFVSPDGDDSNMGLTEQIDNSNGPLKYLNTALDKIREDFASSGTESYKILLRDGYYHVHQLIKITPKDDFELSIEAYPGEKPVISAGKRITGWKKTKVNGHRCWKVNLPEVAQGEWYFRQLFVNGERRNRPRVSEEGFFEVKDPLLGDYEGMGDQLKYAARDRFIFNEGDIKEWRNINDVNAMVIHYWQEDYLPVKEVDPEKNMVTFNAKSYMAFVRSHPAHSCDNAWYYMDNVFEALDSPGEWYLDRSSGDLYYIPKPGEMMEEVEIYAPEKNTLFEIKGKGNQYAGDVHFKGIGFRHNAIQWDRHYGTGNSYGGSGDAMISLHAASNCSFTQCNFTNLGEYAIQIEGNSNTIFIVGNSFTDMGSGAVKMTSDNDSDGITHSVHFTDNEVHSGGRIFHGATAVLANFIRHGRFLHNHISDFYYNAIVCGGRREAVGCYDNLVMYNHIHTIGQGWLSDMGGIYVHGLQPGMVLRGNKIYDINSACYGGNCIYLDDHAEHVIVERNLLYNTNTNIINMKGSENIIRHNILAFGDLAIIRRASPYKSDSMVANIYRNVMIVNNTSVHRTRNEISIFNPGYFSDLNIIHNIGNEDLKVEWPYHFRRPSEFATIEEWSNVTGNEPNSVFEDPGLKNPAGYDFEVLENSILHKYQIDPGSFKNVGPRSAEAWYLGETKSKKSSDNSGGHVD